MARITKTQFLAAMAALDIEIEHDADSLGHHVHAYSPKGKLFADHGIHNLALWDSYTEAPNWNEIAKEMGTNPLEDCIDPECEVCFDITEENPQGTRPLLTA